MAKKPCKKYKKTFSATGCHIKGPIALRPNVSISLPNN